MQLQTDLCYSYVTVILNPINAELNPICHLLALLGAHHILHVSKIRVKTSFCNIIFKIKQITSFTECKSGTTQTLPFGVNAKLEFKKYNSYIGQ